jgi:hypothetical protein
MNAKSRDFTALFAVSYYIRTGVHISASVAAREFCSVCTRQFAAALPAWSVSAS